jgi:hypothetical protein
MNKQGTKHYSFSHPEMYARKVVLLQVVKYMPRSRELSEAIAIDVMADKGAQKMESVLAGEWSVVDEPGSDDDAGDGGDAVQDGPLPADDPLQQGRGKDKGASPIVDRETGEWLDAAGV